MSSNWITEIWVDLYVNWLVSTDSYSMILYCVFYVLYLYELKYLPEVEDMAWHSSHVHGLFWVHLSHFNPSPLAGASRGWRLHPIFSLTFTVASGYSPSCPRVCWISYYRLENWCPGYLCDLVAQDAHCFSHSTPSLRIWSLFRSPWASLQAGSS